MRTDRLHALLSLFVCLLAAVPAMAQQGNMPAHPAVPVEAQGLLVRPDMTDDEVLNWAAEAAVASMTFGHRDYQERLKNAAGYFTREGWDKFAQGMAASRLLDIVVEQKRSLIAAPAGKGAVVRQGPVDGAYAWHVILPVTLYHSTEAGEEGRQRLNLSLRVARSSQNKDGRGIADWAQVAVE